MRKYFCLDLSCDCLYPVFSLWVYRIIDLLFFSVLPVHGSVWLSGMSVKVMTCHYRLQHADLVTMIAKELGAQWLALNQTGRVFFRIFPKDHENGTCRPTPLVKSFRPAGAPMSSGAVHECA